MTNIGDDPFNDALNRVLLNLGERVSPEQIQEIVSKGIDTESVIPPSRGAVPFHSCIDHYHSGCSECQEARKTGGKISVLCHLKNIVGGAPWNDRSDVHVTTRAHDMLQLVATFGTARITRLFRGLLLVRQPDAIKVVREIEDTSSPSELWNEFVVNDSFEALNKMGKYISGKLRVVALSHKRRARVNRPGPFPGGVGEKTELVLNRLNADDSVDAVWLDVVFSRCHRLKWGPECILPYLLFRVVREEDEREKDVKSSTWMQVERICMEEASRISSSDYDMSMQVRVLGALTMVARRINTGELAATGSLYPSDKAQLESWARSEFYNIIVGRADYGEASGSLKLKPADLMRWVMTIRNVGNLCDRLLHTGGANHALFRTRGCFSGLASYVDDRVCAELGTEQVYQAEVLRCLVSYRLVTSEGPSATATVLFAPNLQVLRSAFELKVDKVRWHESVLTGHVVRCDPKVEDLHLARAVSRVLQMVADSKGVPHDDVHFMQQRLQVVIEKKEYFLISERLSRVNGNWNAAMAMTPL